MAPLHQQQTPATSSQSNPQEPPSNTNPQRSKKKRADPIASPAPRRPDEIEEAESVIVPPPKPRPNRVESSDEDDQDDDDDDVESVYLSDDESGEDQDTTSEEDSDDSDDSVESIPPRQLTRRSTGHTVKHLSSSSPHTIVQTRSETTHWITAQQPQGNNGAITRGTRTLRQQTTMHGQNVNVQQQQTRSSGNSMRFNMSIDVNMSFSGLVTGRNLSFAGGQMSYGWSRRNTQGS